MSSASGVRSSRSTAGPSRHPTHNSDLVNEDEINLDAFIKGNFHRDDFIRAQQRALEAFQDAQLARALRASEETAAQEEIRRREEARVSAEKTPQSSLRVTPAPQPASSSHNSDIPDSRYNADEAAAMSLARSWRVDSLQPALLDSTVDKLPSKPIKKDGELSLRIVKQDVKTDQDNQPSTKPSKITEQSRPSSSTSSSTGHFLVPPPVITAKAMASGRGLTHHDNDAAKVSCKQRHVPPPVITVPSHSKQRSISARDLRVGLSMSPTQATMGGVSQPSTREKLIPTFENPELFTATRSCSSCGTCLASPRNLVTSFEKTPDSSDLLHITCPKCSTVHCRGCFAIIQCSLTCKAGDSCALKMCCEDVVTVALFETLCNFDNTFLTEASLASQGTKSVRQTYIKKTIIKPDKCTRKFEGIFVNTLRDIGKWLLAAIANDHGVQPAARQLFTLSYLPEVICEFLVNRNVSDWVAHSETYINILEVLRLMIDCGLSQMLMQPLRNIEQSCGLQQWIWDQGLIVWESDSRGEPACSPSLSELVTKLEEHRRPLLTLSTRVTFAPTAAKVNSLCDGISYLLLQQLVGGF